MEVPAAPYPPFPPLDGRDVSRVRTEVRLAHLALSGLLAEEGSGGGVPGGTGGTHPRVLRCLSGAAVELESAVEQLGEALVALNEEHG